nr:unnamed protein product [Digitaria exilis]
MPRRQKLKVQWIEKNGPRNASFRKRRDTLIQKTRELSILCSVPAAVVVYGGGEAEPKYRDLPDSSKEAHSLDNVGFMRRRTEKMRRKVEGYRATSVGLEVNLVINDVALGRPREFDEMPRELAGAVVSTLDALRSVIADRVSFLLSAGADAQAAVAAAALPPPPPLPIDEAAALLALQEPLMVPPLAMAAPPVVAYPPQQYDLVADALLLLPAPEMEPELEQSELMVAPAPPLLLPAPEPAPLLLPELVLEPEDPRHPPVVIPPEIAEALLLLLAPEQELAPPPQEPEPEPELAPPPVQEPVIVEDVPPEAVPVPEPQATAAAGVGVGEEEPVDLDFEPRNGSFLLEVADAIIDDGSGRLATEEDVDRLLREYGLEHMKPPK